MTWPPRFKAGQESGSDLAQQTGQHPMKAGLTAPNCGMILAADTQSLDEIPVSGFVLALGIVQKPAALCNKLEQAAAGMIVFLVGFEMLGKRRDPACQNRDLNFRRTGVAFLGRELLHQALLFFNCYRHRGLLFRFMAQAGMSSSKARGGVAARFWRGGTGRIV